VTVQADGSILIVSSEVIVDKESGKSTTINTIVKLNSDGSIDTKFDTSKLNLPSITAVTVQPDGQILIAITEVIVDKESGQSITTISFIRLNADGSYSEKFGSTKVNFSTITTMTVQADSQILIA
jgi:hypothetical protein